MLAGGAAAEVGAGKQDRAAGEARVVQRMVGGLAGGRVLADVEEEEFAETIERHAFHEARGDDAVGIDVVAEHGNGAAGNGGDFSEGHGTEGWELREEG